MATKRPATEALTTGSARKRSKIHSNTTGLSSRVVIEDLGRRNKRSKAPVGRVYVPGGTGRGRLLHPAIAHEDPLDRQAFLARLTGTLAQDEDSNSLDDSPHVVFEDIMPPQRNRQVQSPVHTTTIPTNFGL